MKVRMVRKLLLVAALLLIAMGPLAAQARDDMARQHAPSAGAAPASVLPTPLAPPGDPLAPALPGHIYGDEAVSDNMVRFDLATPGILVPLAPRFAGEFYAAGTFGPDPDFYYAVTFTAGDLYAVDATTGAQFNIGTLPPLPPDHSWTGMTFDVTTGTFYAVSCDISSTLLWIVDVGISTTFLVGPVSNSPCSIALTADGSGQLYSVDIVNDSGMSIDKFSGAGTVLGPLGYDANFAQGMAWDPQSDTVFLTAFNNGLFQAELRAFDRGSGNTAFLGLIGPGDLRNVTHAATPLNYFNKSIVFGKDDNFDGIPDRVVEVGFPSFYAFRINYNMPAMPPVTIKDIVPFEWNPVFWVGGNVWCDIVRADERRNLFSDSFITCNPPPGMPSEMFIWAESRYDFDQAMFHPLECGAFLLNKGAQLRINRFVLDVTDPLCLAAVKDIDGGGLDYTGAGDEDGDGIDDYTEACVIFTDPCVPNP